MGGRLMGRVGLVTGGSRGIGRGICLAFAREGADLVVNYFRERGEAERVADEVRGMGRRALVAGADVGSREEMEGLFEAARGEFGRVDVVVANAAYSVRKPLLELTVEEVRRTWEVSLWGVFHACQLGARMMAETGGGSLIVVSSVHSFRPYRDASAYNGAKAAVNQMAATWAVELAGKGIRVNVLEPGWTDTPGERVYHSEAKLAEEGEKLLLGRLARVDEVAAGAVFLASAESSYVTGSVLRVDGGYSLEH